MMEDMRACLVNERNTKYVPPWVHQGERVCVLDGVSGAEVGNLRFFYQLYERYYGTHLTAYLSLLYCGLQANIG